MAKRFDDELIKDAREENKDFVKKQEAAKEQTQTQQTTNQTPPNEKINLENGTTAAESQNTGPDILNQEPVNNDFREKFDEYFKGQGSIIAGQTVIGFIDDFKTKLLWLYAKKNGIDIPQEALQMEPKSKEFAGFLVDYAIKNKLFGWVEKNPLISAVGVVAISGVSSYLMIEMLKKGNSEVEKLKAENEKLKKQAEENIVKNTIENLDN